MKEVERAFEHCRVNCDNCEREEIVESTDYSSINIQLKNQGWITKKIDDEWCDFCCYRCYLEFIGR